MIALAWLVASASPVSVEIVDAPPECPQAAALETWIAEQVGTHAASIRWQARVSFVPRWSAVLEITDAHGETLGARELHGTTCATVARAAAFSLAFSWLSAHPRTQVRALHSADFFPPPPPAPRGITLAAGGLVSGFAIPAVGFGANGVIAFREKRWSLGAEIDWQTAAAQVNGIGVSRVDGAIVPCAHWQRWAACGVAGGGAVMNGGPRTTQGTTPWLGAAARASLETPLVENWRALIFAELGVESRTRVFVNDKLAWQSAPVWLTLGIDLLFFQPL